MSAPGFRRFVLALAAAFVLALTAVPAYAMTEQECAEQAVDAGDTCFQDGDDWVLINDTDEMSSGDDGGIPGWFGAIVVLMVLTGVGITIWRISTARRLAEDSGMDPGLATQMTLLDEDGLSATYLASNLRNQQPAAASPPPASVADRLAELKSLLDGGLITQAEHDARRQAIIDSV